MFPVKHVANHSVNMDENNKRRCQFWSVEILLSQLITQVLPVHVVFFLYFCERIAVKWNMNEHVDITDE